MNFDIRVFQVQSKCQLNAEKFIYYGMPHFVVRFLLSVQRQSWLQTKKTKKGKVTWLNVMHPVYIIGG